VGANDFYGSPMPHGGALDAAQVYFNPTGKTPATQIKPVGCLIYQNFQGQLQEILPNQDDAGNALETSMACYAGNGVAANPPDDSKPYDLNHRTYPVTGVSTPARRAGTSTISS
jgi:hypothetical protein